MTFNGTVSFPDANGDTVEYDFSVRYSSTGKDNAAPSVRDLFLLALEQYDGQINFDPQIYDDFVLVGYFNLNNFQITLFYDFNTGPAQDGDGLSIIPENSDTPHGCFIWNGNPISGY